MSSHEQKKEPLLRVFMWGINYSISTLSTISVPVMLMPEDFKAYVTVRAENHLFNKENIPSHFKFKEYCPNVFRNLRDKFGVEEDGYLKSLSKYPPVDYGSSGKSGDRFFFSWDKKFIIKSIDSDEVAEMHRILEEYHKHIVEQHSDTLLPQYLGAYRLTVSDVEHYFTVTRNVFSPRLTIHKKYDLKGSKLDRQASDEEKDKDLPTFKDNDFESDGIMIQVGGEVKQKLLKTLKTDVDFLSWMNLMDYSLLIGIHHEDRADRELSESSGSEGKDSTGNEDTDGSLGASGGGLIHSSIPTPPVSPFYEAPRFCGELDPHFEVFAVKCHEDSARKEIYFIGLIDILTRYGVRKRTAHTAKTVKHGTGAAISTVQPKQYASRFVNFISDKMQ